MYKLCVYVPEAAIEKVKTAMFDAGAGQVGHYDHCCWQVLGTGQFRPLEGSKPNIGEQDKVETVVEAKLETVCSNEVLERVISEMLAAHPYETPAYQYWQVN